VCLRVLFRTVLVQRKQPGKLSKTGEGSLADDVSSIDTRHPGTAACTAAGVIVGMCPSMPVSGWCKAIMHYAWSPNLPAGDQ